MIHEIFPVGPLQCNCSVIGDEQTKEAMVIDPGDDIEDVMAIVQRHGLTVKQIVITHAHIDHIGGATKLKRLTGAPILLNQNDNALLKMLDVQATWIGMRPPEKVVIDASLSTGDKVRAGGLVADVLHTPGSHRGQHLPVLRAGEEADRGRYAVRRLDWPHRPARRLVREDHAVAARPGAGAARRDHRRARTRTADHHRRRARDQPVPGGVKWPAFRLRCDKARTAEFVFPALWTLALRLLDALVAQNSDYLDSQLAKLRSDEDAKSERRLRVSHSFSRQFPLKQTAHNHALRHHQHEKIGQNRSADHAQRADVPHQRDGQRDIHDRRRRSTALPARASDSAPPADRIRRS